MCNALPIGSVRLGGEIGRRIDATIRNNMLTVDVDGDFLEPFRRRDAESAYIGLGHFLDALSRFAAYRKDPEVETLRSRILSVLAETREAGGYIGLFPESRRLSHLWDAHETSHLIYGLATDHRYRPDGPSLKLARGLAAWLIRTWREAPERPANQFVMATLDLEPALLNLFAESGEEELIRFCVEDRGLAGWNRPIVEGRWGRIDGHIYDYLSRCIAQLTLMRHRPAFGLTATTNRALAYLLEGDGMMISGELGDHECWHSSQEGTVHLGETCATAYFIRLLDILLRDTGDPLYGDLMERTIYNALFAAQSPDGRRIRYYTPIEGARKFFGPDTYCCPNNFRRIVSELPGMACYATGQGFLINLYTEAHIHGKAPDGTEVELRVSTAYPSEGSVEIEVTGHASAFELSLRIPRWCREAKVTVNGSDEHLNSSGVALPGSLYGIRRTWKRGDTIVLDFPMPVRLVAGRKAQSGRFAVMRGPSVYALSRKRNPALESIDLRLVIADPESVGLPGRDDSVRPGGLTVPIRAWGAEAWYPVQKADLELDLTEFADPDAELVYLKPPIPNDPRLEPDELLAGSDRARGRQGVSEDFYRDSLTCDQVDDEDARTLERLQS